MHPRSSSLASAWPGFNPSPISQPNPTHSYLPHCGLQCLSLLWSFPRPRSIFSKTSSLLQSSHSPTPSISTASPACVNYSRSQLLALSLTSWLCSTPRKYGNIFFVRTLSASSLHMVQANSLTQTGAKHLTIAWNRWWKQSTRFLSSIKLIQPRMCSRSRLETVCKTYLAAVPE